MIEVDLGGLKSLSSRIGAFINGPMSDSIKATIEQTAMPNLVNQIAAQMGMSLSGLGSGFRITPVVSGGAGGLTATYRIPLMENEDDQEDSEGSAMYARFPIVRSGGQLFFIVGRTPGEAGGKPVDEAFKESITEDLVASTITGDVASAIAEAKSRG